jgi:hypothetical protein
MRIAFAIQQCQKLFLRINNSVQPFLRFVAAVAQQCIEEGVNLKVWVETRVYFKILS